MARYVAGFCEDVGTEGKCEGFEVYHAETGEAVAILPTRSASGAGCGVASEGLCARIYGR